MTMQFDFIETNNSATKEEFAEIVKPIGTKKRNCLISTIS